MITIVLEAPEVGVSVFFFHLHLFYNFSFQLCSNNLLAAIDKWQLCIKWYSIQWIDLCVETGKMFINVKREVVSHIRAMLHMIPNGKSPYFNPDGKGELF